MRFTHLLTCFALLVSCTPLVHAETLSIGIDFVGGSPPGNRGFGGGGAVEAMKQEESAGVIPQKHWNPAGGAGQNNLTANRRGSLARGAVRGSDGKAIPDLSVNWSATNSFSTTIPDAPGNNRLMKGYLDTARTSSPYTSSTTQVSIVNLPSDLAYDGYCVIVYFDGALTAGVQDRVARFRLFEGGTNGGRRLGEVYGKDPAGADFGGRFVRASGNSQATATAGNYVVFEGLHATTFTLDAFGMRADVPRAPVNAIQIVSGLRFVPPEQ